MNNDKAKNVLIIVLIILVLACIGYIAYPYVINVEKKAKSDNIIYIEKDNKNEEKVVTETNGDNNTTNTQKEDELTNYIATEWIKDKIRALSIVMSNFDNITVPAYKINPKEYTKEDDEEYAIYKESDMEQLGNILSNKLMEEYYSKLTKITYEEETYYADENNFLGNISLGSSINETDVSDPVITIKNISNDKITADVKLYRIGSNDKYHEYDFILIKENNSWHIDKF